MKKPAMFWKKLREGKVQCRLCPRYCVIAPSKLGFCKARKNIDGELCTLTYGSVVSMGVDPIEKKPFYHFWPGTSAFSIAVPGCTFTCRHCQNWQISQIGVEDAEHEDLPPERVIELAKRQNCKGISVTYSEPTIATEYAIDIGKLAHEENLYNTYVTNGYITPEALEELAPHLDAANVDVKAFTDEFYKKVCGVKSISPVLETCEWLVEHKIHLEITYLVIPRENDSIQEIGKFCDWVVKELGSDVPVHFSRFYPQYKMTDRGPTPVETLEQAADRARKAGIHHVYIGNVPGHELDNTFCYKCGELLIERMGYDVLSYRLKDLKCPNCGAPINVVGEYTASGKRRLF